MSAPQQLLELVERFGLHLDSYKSGTYNEAQLRREFLDPLFKLLGWDIDNQAGYAEAYKDVIHEDALKSAAAQRLGTPDYCFRIGGTRKFFLEAKKPAIFIKEEITAAFQLRSYAWSAKLPLSILSDFEEFAIYDCRIKPFRNDSASKARIFYCTFAEYAEKWDYIASIFSRDALLKGSFDKFAETNRGRRGTTEVDTAFLLEIENWRKELAENLALRNQTLTERELNFAVQRIIDRIVFLRICEDRGTETYGRLQALVGGHRIYPRLCQLFQQADDRYNSGLFHFKAESGRHERPDELTLELNIDDDLLRRIIKHLYYPESPYVFSFIPADILGQVYEQFLGKVITLTAGHRARIEEKPEVRKAGGVYYTPTYIVDYIVRQTVGKLLDECAGTATETKSSGSATVPVAGVSPGPSSPAAPPISSAPLHGPIPPTVRSPQSVLNKVAKLKILDPACGSGSFLIGAYQYLLDWHLRFYLANNPEKFAKGKRPALVQTARGEWKLSIEERKRILVNNIFGVDIDSQAVEVTKLSLLLKVLEGETEQSLQPLFSIFHERALPDLGDNIKCGNSLIGPDFYQQPDLPMLDDEQRFRLNVFDWRAEFSGIFEAGGFDAVIGNPPYIRIQSMKEWAPLEVDFYKEHYASAGQGNYDIYVVFVERSMTLLNSTGKLGFILPHKFFNAQYGAPLRTILSNGKCLSHVVHFGAQQVFAGSTTYTCLIFLAKAGCQRCLYTSVSDIASWISTAAAVAGEIAAESIPDSVWNFSVGTGAALVENIKRMPFKLGDIAEIFVGLQTSADDVFIMDLVNETAKSIRLHSKAMDSDFIFEKELCHPLVSGTDVHGYRPLPNRQYILFPYDLTGDEVRLIPLPELQSKFPKTAAYLLKNRSRLEEREKGRLRAGHWHGYIYLKNMRRQGERKVCVPRLVDRLCAALDEDGSHFLDNVDVGGLTLKSTYEGHDLRYIVGLLNSTLLAWFFPHVSAPFRGNWMSANRQFLSQLPVRTIDFAKPDDYACHARMVHLVGEMLRLHRQSASAKTPHEKTALERQIEATDKQIDALVYELYGLTPEEIAIVEGKTSAAVSDARAASVDEARNDTTAESAKPEPAAQVPNPDKAWADSAHFYSAKEEPTPYHTDENKETTE